LERIVNVGIIGCGLVGYKRAQALGEHKLVACADVDAKRASALASKYDGATSSADPRTVVENPLVELVIVATPHDSLAVNALAALEAGKHVLVEKPAARSPEELRPLLEVAERQGLVAKVGFNHRFHPSLQRAHKIVADGAIGPLMYIRGRYGHGGRPGYELEWRADPQLSGGGELLDQGSHLIDLARWFAGDVTEASGHVGTFFWPMQVEDNAFVCLKTSAGVISWLHASWTEWKNLFSFEIFGQIGKLQIDGLGGSYGPERLTHYRMLPEMGPPETTSWEFVGADHSWRDEFEHFVACVRDGREPSGSLRDGLANLEVVQSLYQRSGA
jgi:predicted dehydrogenase